MKSPDGLRRSAKESFIMRRAGSDECRRVPHFESPVTSAANQQSEANASTSFDNRVVDFAQAAKAQGSLARSTTAGST